MKPEVSVSETAPGEVRPRLGVSSCLLGQPVRFNGGHSRNRFVSDVLAGYVEWVPVCPEVEIGLGAPRESLHLTSEGQLVSTSGQDHTAAVTALAQRRRTELAGLDGYVVKSRSPSCGRCSVRVHAGDRIVTGNGRGVFAERVLAADPLLPAEEEGRLNDPLLRESFVEQVWARARLNQLFGGQWRLRDLIGFHARHKLQLLRHHADGCSAVYLAAQTYLDPFPAGLGLRNHAPGPSAASGKSSQSRQSDGGPAPKKASDATKGAPG